MVNKDRCLPALTGQQPFSECIEFPIFAFPLPLFLVYDAMGHIRVYTYNIRPDTTYFTLCANTSMTSQELIRRALDRLRMKIKDIDLFYMTMELSSRQKPQQQGASSANTAAASSSLLKNDEDQSASLRDVTNVLALDQHSKPLELQMCHPTGKSKFVIQLRYTFPVKIYDYCLSDTSNYKSLLVSQRTTCSDVTRSILNAHKIRTDQLDNFALIFVDYRSNKEKVLDPSCRLFDICLQIESDHYQQIHIRPYGKFAYLDDDDEDDRILRDLGNKRQTMTSSPDLSDFDAFVYSRLANKFREFVL
uniref:Ras-associating domain-containing protein n=1 Tax=Romanomermis culicivorax TaxID=13658 RepID=A0A915HLB7_ROMCU